ISMTITNPDSSAINSVSAEPGASGPILVGERYFLGDYRPSSTGTFSFPFSVSEKASGGVYYVNIRFTWLNGSGAYVKNVQIPLTIKNDPIFLIESKKEKIFAEDEFIVPFIIKNIGGKARNVIIELDSNNFFEMGKNKIVLEELKQYEQKDIELKLSMLENLTSNVYNIPLKITYVDELSNQSSITENLKLTVIKKNPEIKIELASGQQIKPGLVQNLEFIVKNLGEKTAYSVRVGIESQDVFTILEGNYLDLGDIEPNSAKNLTIKAGVKDLKPNYYIQEFKIKTKNEKGEERIPYSFLLGLDIQYNSDLAIFASAKPSPLYTQQEHTLTVVVSNIGISPVKSVVVEIQPDGFELLDIQNQQYIGSLAEDDFSSVQFKIKTKNEVGKKNLKIKIKFLDNYNREHVITKEVPIEIYKKEENNSNLIFGVVIATMLVFLIWFFKLRKRKDKDVKHS
ncbi:MAG: hypothetical protein ACK4J0_02070, partial [Candidatus Anstonellaceae archaeon]